MIKIYVSAYEEDNSKYTIYDDRNNTHSIEWENS